MGFSQSVFPGLWLVGVTADAYRVTDTPKVNLSLLSASAFCVLSLVKILNSFFFFYFFANFKFLDDTCRGRLVGNL